MSELSRHIGERIRRYRKGKGLTLQQLADQIHKSRATVSKYETGEITLDVDTLYEISAVLQVGLSQLTDYRPEEEPRPLMPNLSGKSPFFQAERLYFYFYDGRHHRMKDGVINIIHPEDPTQDCRASFSISSITPTGRSGEVYYTGKAVYSDMLIRFSFVNQYNALEEDLLYIFNPLERRDMTEGLLCGISSADLMPCAFKCLVTLTPQEHTEEFKRRLMLSKKDLQRCQRMNMLLVDNSGAY